MHIVTRAWIAPLLLAGAVVAQPSYNVSDIGNGCGPTLSADFVPRGANAQLRMSISGAWATNHCLTYWGVDTINWPIPPAFGPIAVPGSTCILYTLPVW